MGKRKTKEQKKIAQLRRQLSVQSPLTIETKTPQESDASDKKLFYKFSENTKRIYNNTTSYTYLQNDLLRTFLLSAIIIALQIILLLLLRAHVIHMFSLQY